MLPGRHRTLVTEGLKSSCITFYFSVFRYQKKVSNIIDDVLEWSPKLALSGMMDKHTEDNATETSNYTSHATTSTEESTDAAEDEDADETQGAADDTRTRSSEV